MKVFYYAAQKFVDNKRLINKRRLVSCATTQRSTLCAKRSLTHIPYYTAELMASTHFLKVYTDPNFLLSMNRAVWLTLPPSSRSAQVWLNPLVKSG